MGVRSRGEQRSEVGQLAVLVKTAPGQLAVLVKMAPGQLAVLVKTAPGGYRYRAQSGVGRCQEKSGVVGREDKHNGVVPFLSGITEEGLGVPSKDKRAADLASSGRCRCVANDESS